MEIRYDPNLKQGFCFLCRTPSFFQRNSYYVIKKNELFICKGCAENKDELEKLKLNNPVLYNEIIEINNNKSQSPKSKFSEERMKVLEEMEQYNENGKEKFSRKVTNEINYDQIRINNGCSQWLTKLTAEELRIKAKEFCKPNPPKGIVIGGKCLYENMDVTELDGEIFKPHPNLDILASNFGRVKYNNKILEQFDPQANNKWKCGYLFVKIKGIGKREINKLVYKLVAETWLKKPVNDWDPSDKAFDYSVVHHITNNGYDNRVENLMYVTNWQHAMIHYDLPSDYLINKLTISELWCLMLCHRQIHIKNDDYLRILEIAKRGYQIADENEKDEWISIFINPVKEYLKYHSIAI